MRPLGSDDAQPHDESALFAQAGFALFQLGRAFGRLPAGRQPTDRAGRPVELSRIQVVQAVAAAQEEAGEQGGVSVGAVAAALAIDPSTASRLVADTIRDGYLARTPAPADNRRARLALTPAGRALATDVRNYQGTIFERITHDWPAAERASFARQFIAFAATVAAIRHEEAGD